MDFDELKKIIRLLKQENLSEITLWEGQRRITVRQQRVAASTQEGPQPAETPYDQEEEFTIFSPLVGTFYRRPSPESDPFVEDGGKVEPGDTLCIIEAMKVMNEIKAERGGRLSRTLVEDGEAVQYGQPLFLFERP